MIDQFQFLGTFDLRNHVYSDYKSGGMGLKMKQGGIRSRNLTNYLDGIDGATMGFTVVFGPAEEEIANQFLAYTATLDPEDDDFDADAGADVELYTRDPEWYYRVYGVIVKPTSIAGQGADFLKKAYDVECYLYNKYCYHQIAQEWTATSQALTETKSVSNLLGHIPVSFESLEVTCAYASSAHVANLALNFGGASQDICTAANTNEVWTLYGNKDLITQVYEDPITSGTIWGQDWTGSGIFDTDHIKLDDEESAYIRLSGPNRTTKPIKMTAAFSIDSGSAEGAASVWISPDGVTWYEVLNQDDFESGATEYSLIGSDHMTDCYVKILCESGTAGKYLNIGSIKFDVERRVEYGGPKVAAGETATATLTGTGTVSIDGVFRSMRRFS